MPPFDVAPDIKLRDLWGRYAEWILMLGGLLLLLAVTSAGLVILYRRSRQSLHELAREEEKFHTVADYTYDWEYWEGPKGEMLYMSPACERITGYSLAEFLADPELLVRIVHVDDRALLVQHRHDVKHEDEAAADFRIVRRDGGVRWIAHACQSVFARDGKFMGRRISNRDMTERKQAEEQLRELNNDFVTLLENTGDFIYFKNHDSRFVFCSQTLANITGHRSWRDMIGKNDLEVFPGDTARIYYEEELPIFREGKPLLNKTDPYYDEQGKQRWVNTNKWPVFGDDKRTVVGIFGISRDITELKEAEDRISQLNRELEQRVAQRTAELETALYDLENFNYSASHDLRIPLRAVDGFSKILLDEHSQQLDAEGMRLLKVVRDNTRKMSQLIDDMQAFSHAGRMPVMMSRIDMDALVHEVADELRATTSGRSLSFEIGSLPPVYADRPMMRRVVLDLLANAIKFTRPKATALIEVGARTGDKEIEYFVKDNGVGFDMKFADMLFGVFQRLHGVEEFEGAGIGLAIVKRIVTRMGGRVWAEGKVNEGATMYFSLPHREGS
jgi:PAS domain S-box-containing protein